MDLFLKVIAGAVIVLLIQLAATSKSYYIAGLIPLFPTFSLISHYIVGKERAVSDLSETILFGIWSLIPLLFYLLTLYVLVERFSLITSLFISTSSWGVFALLLVVFWSSPKEDIEDKTLISTDLHIFENEEEEEGFFLSKNDVCKIKTCDDTLEVRISL